MLAGRVQAFACDRNPYYAAGMTSCLLSWHGSIVAQRGFSLSLASLSDVIAGMVAPVSLSGDGGLVEVQPIDPSGGRPLYAVRAGNVFLTATPGHGCGTASHIQGWEQFLALPVAHLPELQRLVSRPWYIAAESFPALRPAIQDFQLRVGDWAVALETLDVQAQADGSVLLTGENTSPLRLEPCPSPEVEALLEDVRNVVRRGDQAPWARIRDSFASLQSEAFKVALYPEDLPRLQYLALISVDCGELALAERALELARRADDGADMLYFSALMAMRCGHHVRAAELLQAALLKRFPEGSIPQRMQDLDVRLRQGENALFLVQDCLQHLRLQPFDELFERVLTPMPLSEQDGADIRQVYGHRFEETSLRLGEKPRQALLELDRRFNGDSYWNALCGGHQFWLAGNVDAADSQYAAAKALSIRTGLMPIHYNCGVLSWLGGPAREGMEQPVPDRLGMGEWHWEASVVPGDVPGDQLPALCLVFGCDAGYFRFLPKLLLSLLKLCARRPDPSFRIRLCLGIDTPAPEQLAFMRELINAVSQKDFGLDVTLAHGRLTWRDAATYTAIRYLMLPEVVRRYACPVITADCDGYFPDDFLTLFDELRATADYGFRLYAYDHEGRQTFGEPWGFGAGISWFGEADRLPEIAAFLHDYLQVAYDPANPTNWCIDQCALVQSFRRFVAPRWSDLRIRFMDEGTPLMVMPHHVGGKDELLRRDGSVSMQDVRAFVCRP
ncbi:hypothetical protein GCM10007872_10710 [Gluconobacter sphaericus NBRC 12467]|uniref:Uncharacterized protein n=2 Tax=Gluconobacter sphaericus TaxID=574987 RepID=A0AA37SGU1_9PROT|nr:hypothetical protein [Gluconobacter sphaericus]MBF0885076.1 hypothetical protein [Gluconobacter sphaericus]GBR51342.1 hypothetical protein AA12467_0571 [Gluconobacter sphaericus NBRC 12467]GEB41880.1 hypothetical protein GSP01_06620 [Gluconobacter sphaericus NBRC 12467]GLQ84163.1 hypothetical protein GCM10007872_10710 [Gluconobacter sphaericus NBRC 12467]